MIGLGREEGSGKKEGEGISQRTYMHDPWTWTTVWRWPEGGGEWGLGGGGKRRKKWGQLS